MKELKLAVESSGKRLDTVLGDAASGLSRSAIQKAIKQGFCTVDGHQVTRPDAKTKAGQDIVLVLPETKSFLEAAAGDVEIIWQDENLAVCNKPPGISVHPCPSCNEKTYVQQLLAHFPQLYMLPGERPGIVHRLDKNTSGLLLVALNEETRLKLAHAFANREVHKEYLAIVAGLPPANGLCDKPIGRHPTFKTKMAAREDGSGKTALTTWHRLWHYESDISLLNIQIFTGRTHQIRVHMAFQGYPVIGDSTYGTNETSRLAPRQMLHAWKLSFVHPVTGKAMRFSVPPPNDFMESALSAQKNMQKIIVTGNQGCGKSSFCQELSKKGIPITSADMIVAKLYAPDGEGASWLRFRFGEELLAGNGSVDKERLFKMMNNDASLRKEVETCIHALVLNEIEIFFQQNEDAGHNFAAAEIPLFFESGMQRNLSDILTVGIRCTRELRWERLKKNRGWPEGKIASIEKWQIEEEKKMAACNYVVGNLGTPEEMSAEADKFMLWLQDNRKKIKEDMQSTLARLCAAQPVREE